MAPREQPPRPPAQRLDLEELLRALEPRLEEIFARYCTTPQDAHQILWDSVLVMRVREKDIHDPEGWLLASVEDRCRRQAEEDTPLPGEEN